MVQHLPASNLGLFVGLAKLPVSKCERKHACAGDNRGTDACEPVWIEFIRHSDTARGGNLAHLLLRNTPKFLGAGVIAGDGTPNARIVQMKGPGLAMNAAIPPRAGSLSGRARISPTMSELARTARRHGLGVPFPTGSESPIGGASLHERSSGQAG